FFSSRRRHTRFSRDWSSDVCSSDLRGYRLAMLDAGISVDPKLTIVTNQPHAGGGLAADQITSLPAHEQPDGYIVPDTRVAGTLEIGRASCREKGRHLWASKHVEYKV